MMFNYDKINSYYCYNCQKALTEKEHGYRRIPICHDCLDVNCIIHAFPDAFFEISDQIHENGMRVSYFTIGKGKAHYHMIYLPDNSCGLYYALRIENNYLKARRAIEPNTLIKIQKEKNHEN